MSRKEQKASMDDLQESMMEKFQKMLVEHINKPQGSIAPNLANNAPVLILVVADASKESPTATENRDAKSKGTNSSRYNAYPPPPSYHSPNFYPMPQINSHGPPRDLDKSNFVNWQTLMSRIFVVPQLNCGEASSLASILVSPTT
jgi:hypothetical protein